MLALERKIMLALEKKKENLMSVKEINVSTECDANLSNSFWDISLKISNDLLLRNDRRRLLGTMKNHGGKNIWQENFVKSENFYSLLALAEMSRGTLKSVDFILWGLWILVRNVMAIRPVVEAQSGGPTNQHIVMPGVICQHFLLALLIVLI